MAKKLFQLEIFRALLNTVFEIKEGVLTLSSWRYLMSDGFIVVWLDQKGYLPLCYPVCTSEGSFPRTPPTSLLDPLLKMPHRSRSYLTQVSLPTEIRPGGNPGNTWRLFLNHQEKIPFAKSLSFWLAFWRQAIYHAFVFAHGTFPKSLTAAILKYKHSPDFNAGTNPQDVHFWARVGGDSDKIDTIWE